MALLPGPAPQGGAASPSRCTCLRTLPGQAPSARGRGAGRHGCAVASLSLWRRAALRLWRAWPCFSQGPAPVAEAGQDGDRRAPHLCKQLSKGRRERGALPPTPGQVLPGGDRSCRTLNFGRAEPPCRRQC